MKKRKIFAKTLNPESFDYRAYEYDVKENEDVIIDGGREYSGINTDELNLIDRLHKDFNSWDYESCLKTYYDNSITKYLKDMLDIELTPYQAGIIHTALKTDDKVKIRIACLSIMHNKKYKMQALRGYCQGEVVYLYAPVDFSQKFIDFIEAWYFGTGTEIEIDDTGRNYVDNANDIEGYTFYTATWKEEDLKKEIIENALLQGETEDDVELVLWKYKTTQTIRIDQYELAE